MERTDSKREYGIDLLRIVAMIFIVTLHVLAQGGITSVPDRDFYKAFVSQYLYDFVVCGVNVFALISGYVCYTDKRRRFHLSRLVLLWLQVVFVMLLETFLAWIFDPTHVSGRLFLRSLLPLTFDTSWYFTGYSIMFFFIPLMNDLVRKTEETVLKRILFVIPLFCLIWSIGGAVPGRNLITYIKLGTDLNHGYSFVWLCVLFIIGASIKKCGIGKMIQRPFLFISSGIIVIALNSALYAYQYYGGPKAFEGSVFLDYLAPNILIVSMIMLIVFSNIEIKEGSLFQKAVSFAAPSMFTIYIVHTHDYFWYQILNGLFAPVMRKNIFVISGFVALFIIVLFVSVILLDKLRQMLFKLLRIEKLIDHIISAIEKFFRRLSGKLIKKGD